MPADFFSHIKYWPVLFGYALIRLLILLPYSVLMRLSQILIYLFYPFTKRRRKIITINISRCFPMLSQEEKQHLIKENLGSTLMSFFETALAYWAPNKKLQKLFEIEGLEHLNQSLQTGHGVILLSAHLTMFDLALRMLNMSLEKPVHMLYRAHNNALFEYLIHQARKKHCQVVMGKKDLRSILNSLASNHAVWYAPDQNFSYHMVFAPFFGIQAATVTGTSRIARESKAKVVPFFFHRKPHYQGYTLTLQPALTNFPDNDLNDTIRINQLIEQAVKQHPEQYLWAHRRFKTRPVGEPPFYQ